MVGACAVDLEYDSVAVGRRQGQEGGRPPGEGGREDRKKFTKSFYFALTARYFRVISHFFRGNRTPEFSFHSAYGRSDRSPEHEVSAGLNRARSFHHSTRSL
jgi:hypothetical protein